MNIKVGDRVGLFGFTDIFIVDEIIDNFAVVHNEKYELREDTKRHYELQYLDTIDDLPSFKYGDIVYRNGYVLGVVYDQAPITLWILNGERARYKAMKRDCTVISSLDKLLAVLA